jgi:hypothetical protein
MRTTRLNKLFKAFLIVVKGDLYAIKMFSCESNFIFG